jgi:hypothetical protein
MAQCFTPLFGKRIRVTKLDECGNVDDSEPDCTQVTTDGFIEVSLTSEVESGTEIITRKANGNLCVNERQADSFKRFTLGLTFCGVDVDLLALTTNAESYGEDGQGLVVPEGTVDNKFAFELWTGLTGQACEPGVEEASGYLLLPFVNGGVLGDLTINGENSIDFTMTGAYTLGNNNWLEGPYDVTEDGPLPEALDPLDHLLLMPTNLAPPPSACGCGPLPAAGS